MVITNISRLKIKDWESDRGEKNSADQLQSLCDQLTSVLNELEAVVTGMGKIEDQFIALTKLEDFQKKGTDLTSILFNSLPTSEFSKMVEQIKIAYSEELEIKKCIAENVAHCVTRDEMNFHGISWSHQTSITTTIKRKLESLVIETDH